MPYDASKDPYATTTPGINGLGRRARAVTPSDTDDLQQYTRIQCLTSGNVAVIPIMNDDNDPVAYVGLAAGAVLPVWVRRVMSTGTTATVRTCDPN
jgi:hypothetical protein